VSLCVHVNIYVYRPMCECVCVILISTLDTFPMFLFVHNSYYVFESNEIKIIIFKIKIIIVLPRFIDVKKVFYVFYKDNKIRVFTFYTSCRFSFK